MKPWRVTIHCTATRDGEHIPVSTIESWHKARGFKEIGYHFIIQPDGLIETGRSLDKDGAHVADANSGNIGIVMCGLSRFTGFSWNSLKGLLDVLVNKYNIAPWEIHCHNQFISAQKQGKTCPGFSANRLLAWYIGGHEQAIEPHKILKG